MTSDTSANKATSDDMGDVKDAKNDANKAKDAQTAYKDVRKQNEKIRNITHNLTKQRQRLAEFD